MCGARANEEALRYQLQNIAVYAAVTSNTSNPNAGAQIVGKIRLATTPLINHWWNVRLYVSARGLTTSPMTYEDRIFEIGFYLIDHKLVIECSDGAVKVFALRPESVADFYERVMAALEGLDIHVKIWPMPVEVPSRPKSP